MPTWISCTPSSTSQPVPVSEPAAEECVVATPNPGAEISGLSTPSRRGPTLENEAIAFIVGAGLKV